MNIEVRDKQSGRLIPEAYVRVDKILDKGRGEATTLVFEGRAIDGTIHIPEGRTVGIWIFMETYETRIKRHKITANASGYQTDSTETQHFQSGPAFMGETKPKNQVLRLERSEQGVAPNP